MRSSIFDFFETGAQFRPGCIITVQEAAYGGNRNKNKTAKPESTDAATTSSSSSSSSSSTNNNNNNR